MSRRCGEICLCSWSLLYGQLICMSYYEIIVIYDKEYGEVIAFESNVIMNDSNDIVTEAIRLEMMDEEYRNNVRWAHCVSEFEYEYIKKERTESESDRQG